MELSIASAMRSNSRWSKRGSQCRHSAAVLSYSSCLVSFSLNRGLIFIGLGVYMYLFNAKVWEKLMRYDETCDGKAICTVQFEVTGSVVDPKVFIYYEIK